MIEKEKQSKASSEKPSVFDSKVDPAVTEEHKTFKRRSEVKSCCGIMRALNNSSFH